METPLQTIHGEPSYRLSNESVEAFITRRGGHLAPVTFRLGNRRIQPYSLAPWEPGEISQEFPPLLQVLRGDFFCLPFGPNPWSDHYHGDSANGEWTVEALIEGHRIHMGLSPHDLGGQIRKIMQLEEGQTAIYQEHQISGLNGQFSYGHHAILDLSPCVERKARISVSPIKYGSTYPGLFSNPEKSEYGCLQAEAEFDSLRRVPQVTGGYADLTLHPERRGYEDLVMVATADEVELAWSAAVMDGYVWYCLKNPRDFPATILWISNGGRHSAPWSGRHYHRLAIEEVCSYFCDSVLDSRKAPLAKRGIATTRKFTSDSTTSLRMIQGVAPVDAEFNEVADIRPQTDRPAVDILDPSGRSVSTEVHWQFVLNP